QLESQENECQQQIHQHEEQLANLRSTFEEVTEVASKARVDVEASAGNVNAIQREHENLSRIVISLGARATQLQQEIESLARKREETEAAVERSRGELDESLKKLHDLSEIRVGLEAEVAKLSDGIEKIGPVNVLAIDEHTELEQRESFLRTQRDDLVQAIESLRGTIRKINLTSRELFRDAFNAINEYFTEIFTSLF